MTIDARFVILWNFEFFEKRTWKQYRNLDSHPFLLCCPIIFLRKNRKLVLQCFRSFLMKSERPNNGFIIMRCTQYATLLGPRSPRQSWACLYGITDHRPNSIAQRLYVLQRYHHKILHIERHLRQLTMSLARVSLPLARSTNHEPDRCLCLFRST